MTRRLAEGRWVPVVRKLLSKNREDRYSSAQAVLDALSEPVSTAPSTSGVTRLIVLPFRILRPHQESDFLAVSLPDAIATSLAGIESFVVRSTMMASKLVSAEFDVKMISERAQVDAILTGTILADGGVSPCPFPQLMHAPDGALMWSNTAQTSLRDVFKLQDELVNKIAQSLSQPLTAGERSALKKDVPASALAYELYLRANQLTATGAVGQNPQAVAVARDLYARSTEEDPNFAPAWAGLGRMYRIVGKYAMGDLDEHFHLADPGLPPGLRAQSGIGAGSQLLHIPADRFGTFQKRAGTVAEARADPSQRRQFVCGPGSRLPLLRAY